MPPLKSEYELFILFFFLSKLKIVFQKKERNQLFKVVGIVLLVLSWKAGRKLTTLSLKYKITWKYKLQQHTVYYVQCTVLYCHSWGCRQDLNADKTVGLGNRERFILVLRNKTNKQRALNSNHWNETQKDNRSGLDEATIKQPRWDKWHDTMTKHNRRKGDKSLISHVGRRTKVRTVRLRRRWWNKETTKRHFFCVWTQPLEENTSNYHQNKNRER